MATFSTLFLKVYPLFCFIPIACGMKFAFKIKTKPVTHAVIIIGIFVFSSGPLATISVYLGSPSASIVCAFVLAIIVYLALHLAPH
jgi:hypothetical protein